MSKWVCIKGIRSLIKEGDILECGFEQLGKNDPEDKIFYYIFEGHRFYRKFHWKYFIPYEKWLAEYREQQIKTIIDES